MARKNQRIRPLITATTARPDGYALSRFLLLALAVLTALALSVTASRATGIDITTSNDILADNPVNDDLYTASLAIDFKLPHDTVQFRENLFTDRAGGKRFDETSLSISLGTRPLGKWYLSTTIGAMQVGSGVLGEEAQNALHELIGDPEVELEYPEDNDHFGLVQALFERPTSVARHFFITPTIELNSAPGFKSHAKASIKSQLTLSPAVSLFSELGYRATDSSYAILEPHIRELGVVYDVTLGFGRALYLSYSQNRFGVGQRHLRLYFKIHPDGRPGIGAQ